MIKSLDLVVIEPFFKVATTVTFALSFAFESPVNEMLPPPDAILN